MHATPITTKHICWAIATECDLRRSLTALLQLTRALGQLHTALLQLTRLIKHFQTALLPLARAINLSQSAPLELTKAVKQSQTVSLQLNRAKGRFQTAPREAGTACQHWLQTPLHKPRFWPLHKFKPSLPKSCLLAQKKLHMTTLPAN